MAESGSGQEKTEEPTSKKKQQTRSEGNVPRSRELNTLIMLILSGIGFLLLGGHLVNGLTNILHYNLSIERRLLFDTDVVVYRLVESIKEALLTALPMFSILVVTAIIAPMLLSGWSFSTKALVPKISRMDPIKGLAKLFSTKGLVELLKALAKFIIVATVGYILLKSKLPQFLQLSNGSFEASIAFMGNELIWIFLMLSSALILVALADVPYQLWTHTKQLKMTLQEVKDEHKETEGSPELKSRIRSTQREIAMRRMMESVPEADVVVTNPTHFAVALKYDQLNMSAPTVVAIGADIIALQIRKVADANDVPILEAPPLARSLYYNSEIGQEIPAGLYLAVAQVLAYIYQLKQYHEFGGLEPQPADEYPIPDDYRRDP